MRPVKMLLSDAVPMPVKVAKVCWFMCCASISCRILSFIFMLCFYVSFLFSSLKRLIGFVAFSLSYDPAVG